MRLGLFSDVHADPVGLELVLSALSGVDALLCAGDVVSEYRWSSEVCASLRRLQVRTVMGNHDSTFLRYAQPASLSDEERENLEYLRSLPRVITLEVDGKSLLLAHGDPTDPGDPYVFPGSRALPRIAQLGYDFVVLGHTHYPMLERIGSTLVVNPGSCAETRSPWGRNLITCAVLDTVTSEVQLLALQHSAPYTVVEEVSFTYFHLG